jgi:light-regulated signal transduction histidine kinase (bacteriophytochrome)
MGQLIDNLLEFSRIGKQHVSMGNVNINQLANAVVAELKQDDPRRMIHVTVKNLENVNGDRNMLKQVFINLISNAFKYTGTKDEAIIEIGSYLENEQCIYYVKDNGAGFDMQYYDKLFGVFQRLHSSNEFEGTGVGLAIIQKIIAKHGGKVWAEGKVDEGACFYISLPNLI